MYPKELINLDRNAGVNSTRYAGDGDASLVDCYTGMGGWSGDVVSRCMHQATPLV